MTGAPDPGWWQRVWRATANAVGSHVEAGRALLLTEDTLRFAAVRALATPWQGGAERAVGAEELSSRRAPLSHVTLKQQVEDPRSPLRQFLDTRMPGTASVRAEWSRAAATDIDIKAPATLTLPSEGSRRYPADTVGHAASLRVIAMFSPELPAATVPGLHPLSGLPWPSAEAAHAELASLAAACVGLDPLPDETEQRLLLLCFVAGVLDQIYRTPPAYRADILLLDLPADMPLDELLAAVPGACIDDLRAVVTAARPALCSLAADTPGPVVVAPSFTGSPDVDRAEADLIVGATLVELKARGKHELQQRHLHQLVSYALLDYDDQYGITDLAMVSLRHASVVRWPLQRVADWMTGAAIPVATLRTDLRTHLAATGWL